MSHVARSLACHTHTYARHTHTYQSGRTAVPIAGSVLQCVAVCCIVLQVRTFGPYMSDSTHTYESRHIHTYTYKSWRTRHWQQQKTFRPYICDWTHTHESCHTHTSNYHASPTTALTGGTEVLSICKWFERFRSYLSDLALKYESSHTHTHRHMSQVTHAHIDI